MKSLKKLFMALLAFAAVFALSASLVSCSDDDDDDSGSGTPSVEYSGSYKIGDTSFSVLKINGDKTYSMTGDNNASDSGTWELASAQGARAVISSEGTYTFTSNQLSGTFSVEITQTTVSMSAGTGENALTAEGSGVISNTNETITAKLPGSVGTNELAGKTFVDDMSWEDEYDGVTHGQTETDTLHFNANTATRSFYVANYEDGVKLEEYSGVATFNYSWDSDKKLLYSAYTALQLENGSTTSIANYVANLSEFEAAWTIKDFLIPEVYKYETTTEDGETTLTLTEYYTGDLETCHAEFEYGQSGLEIELSSSRIKIDNDADLYKDRVAYVGVPIFDSANKTFTAILYKRTIREATEQEIEDDVYDHYHDNSSYEEYGVDVYSDTPVGTLTASYDLPTTHGTAVSETGTIEFKSVPSVVKTEITTLSENTSYTLTYHEDHHPETFVMQ